MEEDAYQKLRDYSLKLLSLRPRSVKEISTKLRQYSSKRDFPKNLVERLINELKNEKLLDDYKFACWWRDQRHSHKPKGKKAIKMELREKGIEKEVIETALVGGEEEVSEYDLAMKVINKKLNLLTHLKGEKLKIKVRDLLLRRGFDWETIYKAIDSLTQKE